MAFGGGCGGLVLRPPSTLGSLAKPTTSCHPEWPAALRSLPASRMATGFRSAGEAPEELTDQQGFAGGQSQAGTKRSLQSSATRTPEQGPCRPSPLTPASPWGTGPSPAPKHTLGQD